MLVLLWIDLLQLFQDLSDGHELAVVDVFLVHLVGNDDQTVLGRDVQQLADGLGGQDGPGGVAGVDDHQTSRLDACALGLGDDVFQVLSIHGPVFGLVQVVRQDGCVVEGQGRGVQRILWDWDQEACVGLGRQEREEIVDGGRGARGEVDFFRVGLVAVSLADVICDNLSEMEHPLGVGVGTDGAQVGHDDAGALQNVLREDCGRVGVVEQVRVLQERQDLSVELERLLVQLLRVADVGVDDLGERDRVWVLVELLSQLLCACWDLAAHRVLGLDGVLVEVALDELRRGRELLGRDLVQHPCDCSDLHGYTRGGAGLISSPFYTFSRFLCKRYHCACLGPFMRNAIEGKKKSNYESGGPAKRLKLPFWAVLSTGLGYLSETAAEVEAEAAAGGGGGGPFLDRSEPCDDRLELVDTRCRLRLAARDRGGGGGGGGANA